MAEIDQRSGTDRRGADGRSGIHTGFSLGRTALTGWALTAVLGLAGFGTTMGATPVPIMAPVPVADTTPLGEVGNLVRGSAAAVDPGTSVQVGRVVGALPALPMDTVTAASVPTPVAVPGATAATDGPSAPAGGATPATGATVPAGPAAQLRQAAFTAAAPDQRASLAIRTALAQIGLPYVWGGDGPTNGDAGFDCSGLTTFSYGSAGVQLPRTAHTQYNAGPHVPGGAPLQPGDLVFYGTSARVHHVGMYLGAGRMVNAPTFGKPVQVAFYRYRGDDYLGATRPAAAGGLITGVLPYVDPVPAVPDIALAPAQRQQQAQARVFQAPTASLPAVLPQPGDAALPSEQESAARSIAESDVVTGAAPRAAAPQPIVGPVAPAPVAVDPPAGDIPSGGVAAGGASDPVAGTTTSSSAPITTSPVAAPLPPSSSAVAAPSSPAGSAASTSSTTVAPVAPSTPSATTPAPITSSSAPVVVEKAAGSTTATTTLAPTSTVRTTTPKATTSKVTTPKTTTPSAVKTVTSPTTTAKAVTTTSKPAAKTEDDDPTTTKTSTSKTSTSKTSKATTSEEKTSEEKASEESSSSDESDD